jgi:hypothetical protein
MTATTRTLKVGALAAAGLVAALAQPWKLAAQAPAVSTGVKFAQISQSDIKEWLSYLASDALQGRQAYTEGYGLASAYVAEHLRQWGVKPMGDNGLYFQTVKNRGYTVTRNSSVTVEANGQTRTFKHGDHVTFAVNAGGRQTLTFSGVEFAGYGIVSQQYNHNDFAGRDVRGKLVTYLNNTPAPIMQALVQAQAAQAAAGRGGRGGRGGLGGNRTNYAIQTLGAAGVLAFAAAPAPPSQAELALAKAQEALAQANQAVADARAELARGAGGGGRGFGGGGGGGRAAAPPADITTVQNVNAPVPPVVTGDEVFFDFLFAPQKFADVRARADKGEPLPPMTINAKITINIDNRYDVVSTQLTKNVVGMVEGSDPKLKDTYVMFGAHLDHIGYRTSAAPGRGGRAGGAGAAGTPPSGEPDLISNGADDDGSGSTGLLGIAKAFATGPKPKRSVIFVWHTAEESGLLGSRYMADFPVVPLANVQAQFNIDMIGRNRDDDPALGESVFVIGADRISTDLHNLVVDTNASFTAPLKLDFEYNDPSDPNSFYTRSDHYSYAAKGIPIAFFFTGTHPDYHGVGDHPDKILYPKLTRIAQLVYQAGFNVANSDRTLERDNKGPRSGRGFSGRIPK